MPHRLAPPPRRGRTPSKPGGTATAQVQSLTRGLSILEALARAEGGLTLTDVSQRADLPPSTTHRLLATLDRMGYVYQAGELGRWYVGLQAFAVGSTFLASRDFVTEDRGELTVKGIDRPVRAFAVTGARAQRTRFDFSHPQPVRPEEMRKVEALVNDAIRRNYEVSARIMKFDDALKAGALAFFGDKYGEEVRVVGMGEVSTELCGGTHVRRTGDIGFFKIVSESSVAAGVRRLEAVTGEGALAWVQQMEEERRFVEGFYQVSGDALKDKLRSEREERKALEKELARLKSKLAASQGVDLAGQAVHVKGARVLAAALEGADAKTLRETMDSLKERLKPAAIVLGAVSEGKVTLIAGVTPELTAKVKAGELVNFVAQQVGGKGGGRPDMAQAGGNEPAKLPAALESVKAWVEQRI